MCNFVSGPFEAQVLQVHPLHPNIPNSKFIRLLCHDDCSTAATLNPHSDMFLEPDSSEPSSHTYHAVVQLIHSLLAAHTGNSTASAVLSQDVMDILTARHAAQSHEQPSHPHSADMMVTAAIRMMTRRSKDDHWTYVVSDVTRRLRVLSTVGSTCTGICVVQVLVTPRRCFLPHLPYCQLCPSAPSVLPTSDSCICVVREKGQRFPTPSPFLRTRLSPPSVLPTADNGRSKRSSSPRRRALRSSRPSLHAHPKGNGSFPPPTDRNEVVPVREAPTLIHVRPFSSFHLWHFILFPWFNSIGKTRYATNAYDSSVQSRFTNEKSAYLLLSLIIQPSCHPPPFPRAC